MTNELSTEINEAALAHISQAQTAYERATALIVSDQPQYNEAGDFIAELKSYKKKLDAERHDITDPLDVAKKKILAKFKPHIEAIDAAISSINTKMVNFFRAQEKIRIEAEAKAAEKARKEQEKLQKRAEKAADKGQDEKADGLNQQASMVTAAPVEPTATKQTASTTMVTTYKALVFDKLALIEAVAKGDESMELLEVNQVALNKMATAQKESMKIAGVKVISNQTVRSK